MVTRPSIRPLRVAVAALVAVAMLPLVPHAGNVGAAPGDASERFFGADGEEVGRSVDRDGAIHLIGGAGVAYVVRRDGTDWIDEVELTVPGGNPAGFGGAVAIDLADDGQFGVAIVGDPFDSGVASEAGSAHVFEFTPATGWVHVQAVLGDTAGQTLGAGVDVQLLDDQRTANVIVGVPNGVGPNGSVRSWLRRDGVASAVQELSNPRTDGVASRFGARVAVDGGTLVVGAFRDDPLGDGKLPGAAFVFDGDAAGALAGGPSMSWVETHRLSICGVQALPATMPTCGMSSGEAFGLSVDVHVLDGELGDGDRNGIEGVGADVIAVGSPYRSGPGGGDSGGVTIFHRPPGGDWELYGSIFQEDPGGLDRFGSEVRVDGRHLVSSAVLRNAEDGAVFSFVYDGLDWVQLAEGTVGGDGPPVRLGTGLAIDGASVSAGAPFDELVRAAQGSVTEYVEVLPPANFPPVAEDDEYDTWAGDPTRYIVWENDSDPEGIEVFIAGIARPASNGVATVEQGGYSVGYEPDPGFVGVDTFEYEVGDGRSTATATVTMTVLPSLSIADATVDEAAGTVDVAVTANAAIEDGATFDVVAADGSADESDYDLAVTSFAIEPGGDRVTVTVSITDDDVEEPDETFELRITNVVGAGPAAGPATVTILDDDDDDGGDPVDGGGVLGPPFEPPIDTGPTVDTIQREVDRIFEWVRTRFGALVELLPDRDEFGDFVFANWPPALPTFDGLGWPDVCAWFDEQFDTIDCDLFAFERDAPSAVGDVVVMQQGTTRYVNVASNDFDVAARPLFVTADQLPREGLSLTGLTSVDLDAFGTARIVAQADYVGVTSFPYETCTSMGTCATGVVTVEVTAGPPPPVARPDAISIWLGERRPGRPTIEDPVRGGVNLLANDEGTELEVRRFNTADLEGHVADLGTVTVDAGPDGDVTIESTRSDPPIPGQSDLRTFVVPYEACDAEGQCAVSTLEIMKTGFGPQLQDDPITVGRRRSVEVPVLDNDQSGVRLVSVDVGPDQAGNLDPERPPEIVGDRIVLHFSTHPVVGTRVSYRACWSSVDEPTAADCGGAYIVVTKLADRDGPTANDDVFRVGRFAHVGGFLLDVIGPEGGGADSSQQPVGFRVPRFGDRLEIAWRDDRGTPDDRSDDVLTPFAYVVALDQFTQDGDLPLGADGEATPRGLGMFPLTVPIGDGVGLAPAPAVGSTAEFEYEICDIDLDEATARAEAELSVNLDEELCDTAKVELQFVDEAPMRVDADEAEIGLLPGGDGRWFVPGSPIPAPGIRGEPRFLLGETGGVVSSLELGAELIDTPATDPLTGRANEPSLVGTQEVAGTLVRGADSDDEVFFEPSFDAVRPGADVYYRTEITDDVMTGSNVSKLEFVPVDFHATAVVVPTSLAVDGFSTTAELGGRWFVTPYRDERRRETRFNVDWEPTVELRSVRGRPADDAGDLYGEDLGDYRLEVRRGEESGRLDAIRIVPDIGFAGIALVPYEVCATWTAASLGDSVNPAVDLPHEICRSSFVLFDVDQTVDGAFAPPGTALASPFDDTIDPWLEFTIEAPLGDVFDAGQTDGAASIGGDVFGTLIGLFEAAGAPFDATFAGDATLLLTAGVDSTGPYVDGATTLSVEAAGAGGITTTQTLGVASATVTGAASVDGSLSVQLGQPGQRFHITDLDVTGLDPVVDYDLLVATAVDLDAGIVSASPHAAARVRAPLGAGDPDVETTVVVPVRVELPGSDDGTGQPIVVELEGRLEGAGLRVVGTGDVPVGSVVDGFGVSNVQIDLTVDDTGTTGTITADLDVPALAGTIAGAPSVVPLRLEIAGSSITGTATVDLDGLTIGPVDAPIATVTAGDLTVAASGDVVGGDVSLEATFASDEVAILPGNVAGSATAFGVSGTVASGGAATLEFSSLTAGTADYSAITTGPGQLSLGGSPDDPLLVLTSVEGLDVGGVSATLGRVEFFADGRVVVTDGCLASDVGLAETIGLGGILPFDITSACLDGGVIAVEGFVDFSLLDDLPFTPTVTIGDRTVDADSDTDLLENRFRFSMDAATLLPLELGPIRLGMTDLDVEGLTAAGYIEIAGYGPGPSGEPAFDGTFTGEFDVTPNGTAGAIPFGADVDIAVEGEVTIDDSGGSLAVAIDADVRGFLGEYVELTDGAIRINAALTVPSAPAEPAAGPIVAAVSLESVGLAGVLRIPGVESSDDSGGIPVALTYGDGVVEVSAGLGGTYRAGPFAFSNVTGSATVATTGPVTTLTGDLAIGFLRAEVAEIVTVTTGQGLFRFDGDPGTPILRLENVAASILDPVVVEGGQEQLAAVTVETLEIDDDGGVTVGVIEATSLDRLADRFGFGQLLPFTITGLRIDPTDPAAITATVAGTFDLTELEAALPGDDVELSAQLGDGGADCTSLGVAAGSDTFCFTVALDALGDGSIDAVDFGPLGVTITGLDVAGVGGSVSLQIAGYADGDFDGSFTGDVAVATDLAGALSADFAAGVVGAIEQGADGSAALSMAGTVDAALVLDGASGSANATFQLGIERSAAGAFSISGPVIDELDLVACIELPGFSSGPDCDGVVARVITNGSIWTAVVGGDSAGGDGVDITAGGGALTVEGVTGTLTVDVGDPDAPVVAGTLVSSGARALWGGVLGLQSGPISLTFDDDLDTPILAPVTITGALYDGSGDTPDDELVRIEAVDVALASDGAFTVAEIRATELDQAAVALGVADLLPFVVSGLSIALDGDDPTAPEAVTIRAAGSFDLSALAQFDPIVQLGDGTSNGDCAGLGVEPGDVPDFGGTFCFGLRIDGEGLRPVDVGPIRLGLQRVEVGPFTFGGVLELGGFDADGEYTPLPGGTTDVRGTLTAAVAVEDEDGELVDGEIELRLLGDFGTDAEGRVLLALDGAVTGGFGVADVIEVRGATIRFGLDLRLDTRSGVLLEVLDGELGSLEADLLRVTVPGAFTIQALAPSFPLEEGVLLRVPSFDQGGLAGLHFGSPPDPDDDQVSGTSDNPLDGWGGDVAGFEVGLDGSIRLLPGFGVNLSAGASGFPDYLPITIDDLGMTFGDDAAAELAAGRPVELNDVLDQLLLRGSMSISGTSDLPIDASVDGLEIDVGKLRTWFTTLAEGGTPGPNDFFITNLDALFFGVDELGVGPVVVSGGLGLGVVPTAHGPRFWGRVVGGFTYQGYGFGVDLLLSEYGPLSMDVTAPAAMVLGQTGIVVAVNQAGVIFNEAPPPVCTTVVDGALACEGGTSPADAATFRASDGYETSNEIAIAIQQLALSPWPAILPTSFGVFVTGQVSHLAVQAFANGELELGIFFEQPTPAAPLPGVKMIGRGDVNFLGMSLANLVLYADYDDPLAPAWTIAGGIADGGDLLDLLFPVGAQAGLTLDTDGLAVATVLGMRELMVQLTTSAATSPSLEAALAGPLDDLATRLRDDPTSWLRGLLFGDVPDGAITAASIGAAFLDALVPPGETVIVDPDVTGTRQLYDNLAADSERLLDAVELSVALFSELLNAAVEAQRPLGTDGLPLPLGPAQQEAAAAQIIGVVRGALAEGPDAARAAARVIYDVANPAIIGESQIQFELFDIPVGAPVADSVVLITKDGIVVDFDGSIAKLTAATATFINAAGTLLIPLTFVAADQTNFGLSFPFRLDEFLEGGGGEVFDVRNGVWSVSAGSDLYLAGMRVSSADGIIVPGGSDLQLDVWERANTDVDGVPRVIPAIGGPVDTPVRSRLAADGGLYVVGELAVPEMLADPIGWADDVAGLLADLPDEPVELVGYLGDAPATLLDTRPAGRFELFAPTPTLAPGADPTQPTSWDWSDGPFVQAGIGIDLLGYRVADGGFEFVNAGTEENPDWVVVASLELPFLDGPLQAQVENMALGLREGVDEAAATVNDVVRWPTVAIDEQITVGEVRSMVTELGLADVIPDTVDDDTSVRIRGYSPQHHRTAADPAQVAATDPLRVTGGFEIVLDGSIDGVVSNGRIEIAFGFGDGGPAARPAFVRASIRAGELDLGSVVLTDAELTASYDATGSGEPVIDLVVDGRITVRGLGGSIQVAGSLASGVLSTSFEQPISVGALRLGAPQGAPGGPRVTLRRTADGSYRAEVAGDVTLDGWSGTATVDTVLGAPSDTTLDLVLDGFGRNGLLLDGTVSLTLSSTGFTVALNGGLVSVGAIGVDRASIAGRITEAGVEQLSVSDLDVEFVPGVGLSCADLGFSFVDDALAVTGSAGVVVEGLTSLGVPDLPGLPGLPGLPPKFAAPVGGGCDRDGVVATVEVSDDGTGSLVIEDPPQVSIGGVTIDSSTMRVERTVDGTLLRLGGSLNVLGSQMGLAAAASLDVGADGLSGSLALTGTKPQLAGWNLFGTLRLDVSPQQTRFGLTGSISPPFVSGSLAVGPNTWIGLGANPDFSVEITADDVTFADDAFRLEGEVSARRTGNALELVVADATFAVSGIGSVSADVVEVTSAGEIDVDGLQIDAIGSDELRLVGLLVDLERSASTGTVSFRLHGGVIAGTALNGREIDVTPDGGITIQFGSTTGLQRNFTMPGLDLGPAFSWPAIPVRVEASSDRIELAQRLVAGQDSVTATLLGADVELRDLLFRWQAPSNGSGPGTVTVDGTVSLGGGPTDGVVVLGRRLRGTELSLTNAGAALRLELETPRSIGLSPLPSVVVDGWIQSDGQFELSGSWSGSVPGQSVTGTLTIAFDDAGPRFDFVGTATGALEGAARGVMGANNVLLVTVYAGSGRRNPIGTFQLPPTTPFIPRAETEAPEFGSIPEDGVPVWVPADAPDAVRVYFLELASLSVTGASASNVSCAPEDGSFFTVGVSTPVLCTVSNAGGLATAAFDVTVNRELEILSTSVAILIPPGGGTGGGSDDGVQPAEKDADGGTKLSAGSTFTIRGRADERSSGTISIRSERIELGTFTAGDDGRWELTVQLPPELALGEHTVVIDRVVDGVRRLDHVPVVVTEPVLTPSTNLPSTGGGTTPLPWALLLLVVGVCLWIASRSSRRLGNA